MAVLLIYLPIALSPYGQDVEVGVPQAVFQGYAEKFSDCEFVSKNEFAQLEGFVEWEEARFAFMSHWINGNPEVLAAAKRSGRSPEDRSPPNAELLGAGLIRESSVSAVLVRTPDYSISVSAELPDDPFLEFEYRDRYVNGHYEALEVTSTRGWHVTLSDKPLVDSPSVRLGLAVPDVNPQAGAFDIVDVLNSQSNWVLTSCKHESRLGVKLITFTGFLNDIGDETARFLHGEIDTNTGGPVLFEIERGLSGDMTPTRVFPTDKVKIEWRDYVQVDDAWFPKAITIRRFRGAALPSPDGKVHCLEIDGERIKADGLPVPDPQKYEVSDFLVSKSTHTQSAFKTAAEAGRWHSDYPKGTVVQDQLGEKVKVYALIESGDPMDEEMRRLVESPGGQGMPEKSSRAAWLVGVNLAVIAILFVFFLLRRRRA